MFEILHRFRMRLERPKTIVIESTNNCNLNCPFCLVGLQRVLPSTEHRLLPRQLGFMDIALFKKIVRDSYKFGIKRMLFHFQGEPLLHERLAEMISFAKKHRLTAELFTNGILLNGGLADQLIQAGLDRIRFSIDGTTEKTYQENRRGGSFIQAYSNMKMLAEKAAGTQLKIAWQFIVMRNNEHEVEEARTMAEEAGVSFIAKTLAVTDSLLIPLNPRYIRKLYRKPCLSIYQIICVFWNGDVVCCCYDLAGKYVIGNLKNNNLFEIWNSAVYRKLRSRIDNAVNDSCGEPSICQSCLLWGR